MAFKQKVISSALGAGRNNQGKSMFEIFYSMSGETPPGAYPLWEGYHISNCKNTLPDFWNESRRLAAEGKLRAISQVEWDSEVNTYGESGAFVIDTNTESIRLPKITRFVSSMDDISQIGTHHQDQIVNFAGGFVAISHPHYPTTGPFSASGAYENISGRGDNPNHRMYHHFNPGSVVRTGAEVQPKHIKTGLYIQVYNATTLSSMLEIAAFLENFAPKVHTHDNIYDTRPDWSRSKRYYPVPHPRPSWAEGGDRDAAYTFDIKADGYLHFTFRYDEPHGDCDYVISTCMEALNMTDKGAESDIYLLHAEGYNEQGRTSGWYMVSKDDGWFLRSFHGDDPRTAIITFVPCKSQPTVEYLEYAAIPNAEWHYRAPARALAESHLVRLPKNGYRIIADSEFQPNTTYTYWQKVTDTITMNSGSAIRYQYRYSPTGADTWGLARGYHLRTTVTPTIGETLEVEKSEGGIEEVTITRTSNTYYTYNSFRQGYEEVYIENVENKWRMVKVFYYEDPAIACPKFNNVARPDLAGGLPGVMSVGTGAYVPRPTDAFSHSDLGAYEGKYYRVHLYRWTKTLFSPIVTMDPTEAISRFANLEFPTTGWTEYIDKRTSPRLYRYYSNAGHYTTSPEDGFARPLMNDTDQIYTEVNEDVTVDWTFGEHLTKGFIG